MKLFDQTIVELGTSDVVMLSFGSDIVASSFLGNMNLAGHCRHDVSDLDCAGPILGAEREMSSDVSQKQKSGNSNQFSHGH